MEVSVLKASMSLTQWALLHEGTTSHGLPVQWSGP